MAAKGASRTARFAQFLRAAVAVKTKTVGEVNKYPTVIWFSSLPTDIAQIRSPLLSSTWDPDDVRWLTISRVAEPELPPAPEACQPWLEEVDLKMPEITPSFNTTRIEKDPAGGDVLVEPTADVLEGWARYLEEKWKPWAERATLARRIRPVYQKLFAAHQEMRGRDDAYDFFVGVGLLHDRTDPHQPSRRHLLSFRAELSFDSKTGMLTVLPAADFDHARAELDFLPPSKRAIVKQKLDQLASTIGEVGPQVQERKSLGQVVSSIVHSLNASSTYADELEAQDAGPGEMCASFAPAVILRPRTARSIDELLERIERDASGDNPRVSDDSTPMPWRRLIEDEGVWSGLGATEGETAPTAMGGRVYFPLPSNEEQSRIVRYAAGTAGVVVQGPPGTGKSHTIANLISHYLAEGKRVLVTAQSAQALHVLRDKLPQDLQTLCVSLLGSTSASDRELQRSVKGILSRRQEVEDPRLLERTAAELEARLVESEERLVSLERSLRDTRAAETETLEPMSGYRGTRAAIARQLVEEQPALGWISDEVPHETPCPAYCHGGERLARYHFGLNGDVRRALGKVYLDVPFEASTAILVLERIQAAKTDASGHDAASEFSIRGELEPEALATLFAWLEALQACESETSGDDSPWLAECRTAVLRGDLAVWRVLQSEAAQGLDALSDDGMADARTVEVREGRTAGEARQALTLLSEHYRAGGRRRILWAFRPAVVRDAEWIEQAVRLEGGAVRTPADVDRARRALDAAALLDAAWAVWARWPTARAGSPRQQRAALRNRLAMVNAFLALGPGRESVSGPLRQWLSEMAAIRHSTRDLLTACGQRLAALRLARAWAERDRLVADLDAVIGRREVIPALLQLREALVIEDLVGARDALARMADEKQQRELHASYVTFLENLGRHAPRLAEQIVADEGTDKWARRLRDLAPAWNHRCAATWLTTVLAKERLEATDRAARDEGRHQQDLLREIAVTRAWQAALQRIDDRSRAALVAWSQAVATIPASGKSVFRRRAVARSYLGKCLDVMPAWVVSLGRLYETIDPRPGMFDIAVVDEASQCWLDSLVLFYLAKQIIVVGDDKQISPTVVGVSDGEIDGLARAYISDFEWRGSFTIDSSLFDHAQRYLSAGVPLQEHFRCVPEIIRFSNELCYTAKPLIPLRQCGRNRLTPLKTTYLADGLRHGDINDAEARAVVEAIVSCDADEAYEDAHFGVICLQGDDQAARIQQLLLERLGPGIFEKRRLRCGNPYAFQGDERHVMFLSMVAAPNANNAPLTTRMYEQRFNVALSRAQDQMWLFHSVREGDVSPRCLRRRVLEFFCQPTDPGIRGSALNVPQLQLIATRADRQTERPPAPFDSWFELDVALALAARGFTLSAQVQVAKRRIDLVIEGDGTRLAVECDGEAWHGPERFADDLFRQRQLERAGWRFARIRESLFYSDSERAIADVIAAWDELGLDSNGRLLSSGAARHGGDFGVPADAAGAVDGLIAPILADATGRPDSDRERIVAPQNGPRGEELDGSAEVADMQGGPSLGGVLADDERHGPFSGYGSKGYPDPHTAPAANIRDAVLDIVRTDGPLPKASIYRLYRDGCPAVERVGKSVRQAVNRAAAALERDGLIETRDEGGQRDPADVLVKLQGQAWVDSRPGGNRGLDDVPISELAAAMRTIDGMWPPESEDGRVALYRTVARQFNVQRLRQQWLPRLRKAEGMLL